MPLKIIWALLDMLTIAVIGSGLYLWFVKWRKTRRGRVFYNVRHSAAVLDGVREA
jgi:uncharacterized iron-regulated membrane protein